MSFGGHSGVSFRVENQSFVRKRVVFTDYEITSRKRHFEQSLSTIYDTFQSYITNKSEVDITDFKIIICKIYLYKYLFINDDGIIDIFEQHLIKENCQVKHQFLQNEFKPFLKKATKKRFVELQDIITYIESMDIDLNTIDKLLEIIAIELNYDELYIAAYKHLYANLCK